MDAEMVLSMTSRSASKSNIKRSFRFKHGPERETNEATTSKTEDQAETDRERRYGDRRADDDNDHDGKDEKGISNRDVGDNDSNAEEDKEDDNPSKRAARDKNDFTTEQEHHS